MKLKGTCLQRILTSMKLEGIYLQGVRPLYERGPASSTGGFGELAGSLYLAKEDLIMDKNVIAMYAYENGAEGNLSVFARSLNPPGEDAGPLS
jgi:hypothetical protein